MVDVVDVSCLHREETPGGVSKDESGFGGFVGTVSKAGCNTFIIAVMPGWLKGLSPKASRSATTTKWFTA
jgi:hypothetical protein